MTVQNNATGLSTETRGLLLGAVGVAAFSLTFPATRIAAPELGGTVVGLGRALVAAAVAMLVLLVRRERLPARRHWAQLAVIAAGAVVGFPLFTAQALEHVAASRAAVIAGLLPAATAGLAVLRARERPSAGYWIAMVAGLVAVVAFAASQGGGQLEVADLLLLAAVVSAAVGYTEGALLAREIGGWRVISWALVLSAPVLAPVVAAPVITDGLHCSAAGWVGMAYVSLISAYLGFLPWYRGLAIGGVARVGQLQLAQPVLTLGASALLLGEHIGLATLLAAAAVLVTVVLGRRTAVRHVPAPILVAK